MKLLKRILMGFAISILSAIAVVGATAPPQVSVQVPSKSIAETGDRVSLSHGGSTLAKEEFCVNAVVPVYRYNTRFSSIDSSGLMRHEVGKIKVTKIMGDRDVEGVVVEGSIMSGDTAVQPRTGCLAWLPGAAEGK